MLTRGNVAPAYSSTQPTRVNTNGVVRVNEYNRIPQTWAIARPGSSPLAQGAPLYLGMLPASYPPGNFVYRGGTPTLGMIQPRLEMDPSDIKTWQRPYQFTT